MSTLVPVTFQLRKDVAQHLAGFLNSGRSGRITLVVEAREILAVECTNVWTNEGAAGRRFWPDGAVTPRAVGAIDRAASCDAADSMSNGQPSGPLAR